MILASPFVDGFLGLLKGVALMFAILIAVIVFFAVISMVKSAGEWGIGAAIDHPLHATGVVVVLSTAFVLVTGLWAVPLVQKMIGAITALILVVTIGLVVVAKVAV